ncbi:MAG: PLP-dependent cysteine synthase family protein [Brachybacterium sp.]|uniref:PLP-dependent cysteine synthase family protein n=1 Tax=Brachybacterium sp. TaxID=1891286 RepID=UPI002656AB10|nr:PLP-dependent cysteine synthase family protein [Brachybacterium sp.]MDN6301704.1 PLP-dependent cysteine synthase family protein [Brachybacterium sp.]MDN6329751.1 PLP-dependent cysteine synthase family protein [Brachybacterium sp.]
MDDTTTWPQQLENLEDVDRSDDSLRAWVSERIHRLEADGRRSADTHLVKLDLPAGWDIQLYLKDESTHASGSLKHRLARSLFLFALVNGQLRPGMPVIEASSGSTAVSEAHVARMLAIPFVAVIPRGTSTRKIALIEAAGGHCHVVEGAESMSREAQRLADEQGGLFMDQFTHAERATDWRGNNSIAVSALSQLELEPHPVPRWIVVGAGTGGTSATFGRLLRYRNLPTALCVADVEDSAFFEGWVQQDPTVTTAQGSRIEGIGRMQVEPSFVPGVVDRMIRVPDAASVAAARYLSEHLGRRVGASTGTNLVAAARLITQMRERGETGSVLTLLCDPGDRYTDTYFDDDWVAAQGWELQPWREVLEAALPFDDRAASHRGRRGGALQPPSGPGPLRTTLAR